MRQIALMPKPVLYAFQPNSWRDAQVLIALQRAYRRRSSAWQGDSQSCRMAVLGRQDLDLVTAGMLNELAGIVRFAPATASGGALPVPKKSLTTAQ